MAECPEPSAAQYQRHLRAGQDSCLPCKRAHNRAVNEHKRAAKVAGPRHATDSLSLWPGITAGYDARCECTWAPMDGQYQVKVRNVMCVTHGGPLASVLARMERLR